MTCNMLDINLIFQKRQVDIIDFALINITVSERTRERARTMLLLFRYCCT